MKTPPGGGPAARWFRFVSSMKRRFGRSQGGPASSQYPHGPATAPEHPHGSRQSTREKKGSSKLHPDRTGILSINSILGLGLRFVNSLMVNLRSRGAIN